MQRYFRKNIPTFAVAAISLFAASAVGQFVSISVITAAQAKEGHENDGGSSQKGKGPSYKGGRGAEGHGGSDSSHKGSSSHGGGSKTLEETIFKSESGHEEADSGESQEHAEPK